MWKGQYATKIYSDTLSVSHTHTHKCIYSTLSVKAYSPYLWLVALVEDDLFSCSLKTSSMLWKSYIISITQAPTVMCRDSYQMCSDCTAWVFRLQPWVITHRPARSPVSCHTDIKAIQWEMKTCSSSSPIERNTPCSYNMRIILITENTRV